MISILILITGNKSIDTLKSKSKKDKKPNIIVNNANIDKIEISIAFKSLKTFKSLFVVTPNITLFASHNIYAAANTTPTVASKPMR